MSTKMNSKSAFKSPNYDDEVNFKELALQDPDFADIINRNKGRFSFQDPSHVMQLTKSILKRDFRLEMKLPDDRLCPPVPNRWAYVRWIQDLVDSTSKDFGKTPQAERDVIGIDVGVGASCIYPLLGCASRLNWKFFGTDIDKKSYEYALHNVTSNNLDYRIHLLNTSALHGLLPLDALKIDTADFTMCNPPFFESRQDMNAGLSEKGKNPNAVCTGHEVEMITEGGEVEYVGRMITESHGLGKRVQWYTSLLGKQSTLPVIVKRLEELKCHNWAVGLLLPHATTRRWVIGWSWDDLRPANHVARPAEGGPAKELLPPPTCYSIDTSKQNEEAISDVMNKTLSILPLYWSWNSATRSGIGWTNGDVWSRAARRKRKAQEMESKSLHETKPSTCPDDGTIVLAFRVTVLDGYAEVHSLKGSDKVLWESFCAMLKRQMAPTGGQLAGKIETGPKKRVQVLQRQP
ncbi:hypothetical protein EJ08DRAFT_680969 [Tothia fuscella]|uniref:U6 small nuclear RNA (adenine-(43)-N(6))-methyltransferase n=1 Tax=Tothia fuscella TaxID=1048955 RepID=A0A9P4TWC1_9PEZI|nr:hypothetical protein EJ08DRAFT_680969 [Tothia fuscella]